MKKKKYKTNSKTISEKIRRDLELKQYGKILSLRPEKVMKSKKDYSRKWRLSDYE